MKRTIYFQYDTRKHSILYYLIKFNLILIPCSYLIVYLLHLSFLPLSLIILFELILIYTQLDILLFEYKFMKYYENLIVQRMQGDDVDKLKNPLIKLIFKDKGLIIDFYELGYFNNEEYDNIGRAIERFAKLDFESVTLKGNDTRVKFTPKRTPINFDNIDNKTAIALDSKLEWNPIISPNLAISGVTGSG